MAPRKGTGRACDACSLRKVRCDGNIPCSRCIAGTFGCTYIKTHGKPGPKGPRKKTKEAIRRIQLADLTHSPELRSGISEKESSPRIDSPLPQSSSSDTTPDTSTSGNVIPQELCCENSPSSNAQAVPTESIKIPMASIYPLLDIYRSQGYSIWPVVDTSRLIRCLELDPDNMEAYALATAICAVTISQFRIDEPPSSTGGQNLISSSLFHAESKRARETFDHLEHLTVWSLLSSLFLHVYYAHIGKNSSSTILLGEAITKAHLLGLHLPEHYPTMDRHECQSHLRIYWLLFVTERSHSIQYGLPMTLKKAADLPPLEDSNDGSNIRSFIHLCHLFVLLDATITADPSFARRALASAQRQLSDGLAFPVATDSIQRANVSMTQQWMRIFLWQYALSVTRMGTKNEDDALTFSFPVKVAGDVFGTMTNLSRESLEAHGPGMEMKLFDIATSLTDVMIHIPSVTAQSPLGINLRQFIHSLASLLASFRGGNPAIIPSLQAKLSTLSAMAVSPERPISISSVEEEQVDVV